MRARRDVLLEEGIPYLVKRRRKRCLLRLRQTFLECSELLLTSEEDEGEALLGSHVKFLDLVSGKYIQYNVRNEN